MATYEKSALITAKDEAGNTNLIYPITTVDNVEGMDEITSSIEELKSKPAGVTSIGPYAQSGDIVGDLVLQNMIAVLQSEEKTIAQLEAGETYAGIGMQTMIDGTMAFANIQLKNGHISVSETGNEGRVYFEGRPQPFDKPIASAGTGAAYTATVEGIAALETGLSIVLIPHTNSTTTTPTLNINGLGAKYIRQRLTTNTSATANPRVANWLVANKPVVLTYNGTYWVAELARPDANDIYGTVAIANGGTGATTAEAALTNLGAAPAYTYGTADLTAGTSALETGKLYFVYE